MNMMQFHNALRIMRFIDRSELEYYEIDLNDLQWIHFASNPYDWFIRTNDNDKKKLWNIIEDRMEGS